jgi:glycosyltransferase involved in cell wall biosynthesis
MAATNRALTDLTRYLAAQGNEVHIICGGPNPKEADPNAPTNQKVYSGVNIHRITDLNIPTMGIYWRSPVNILRFFFVAGILTLFWGYQFDIVVTLDLPAAMGIWGTLTQMLTFGKTRHVCWMMDMITESRFQLGIWKSDNFRHFFIDYLHMLPYRYAALTIVLGQCMRERLIKRQIEPSKVHIIGVWHYSDLIKPLPFGTFFPSFDEKLLDKFIVMYSGHASSAHTFQAVQEAMEILSNDSHIHFVFVGDAEILLTLESFAKKNNLNNFTRLDLVPWEDLNLLLAGGYVHLVTLRDEMKGICVPSKLYGIMAAGRPTIFVGPQDSQSAQDVLKSDAGFVVGTSDSQKLASIIRYLADNFDECQRLGRNAYHNFLSRHDYSVVCQQWQETLEKLILK